MKKFFHVLAPVILIFITSSYSIEKVQFQEQEIPKKLKLDKIKLPDGFKIDLFAVVPNARSMAISPKGTLFVGTRKDKIYAVVKSDKSKNSEVIVIAEGLNSPNGVAFRNGSLYVAEISRIIRYDDIENRLKDPPEPVVIYDKYPDDKHHGWKYIAFGPDDKLYVPVGAPCNVCEKDQPVYATITRMDPDGNNYEIYAHGIRNTVGFGWHPKTKKMWFTDNGADRMGDDIPPDELNYAPRKGMHFGFPYCHGSGVSDSKFGDKHKCEEFTSPAKELGPHVASLGICFYSGKQFPEKYREQIFIAEHGSWNRSTPIGYRIMMVSLEGNKATDYVPFAEGWLEENGKAWGRPVDVIVRDDGALLISDDDAGVIYMVTYGEN